MFRTPVALLVLAACCLLACASSSSNERADLDPAFRAIQRGEARIEHARATADREEAECRDVCAAASDSTCAQAQLCRRAREAEDIDALSRCEAAQRTAQSVAERARARCTCAD